MIIGFDELARYRHQVAMVDGVFDPLHAGHIEYFRQAAALGLPVLCNVAGDDYVRTKHTPLLPEEQRATIVDAIRYIALTHIGHAGTDGVLRQLQPALYVKGKDWEHRLPAEQVRTCGELGIGIRFLDTVRHSSTEILAAFRRCPAAP